MTKTISGTALRDRLLARLASQDAAGWLEVLAVPSHRDLLGLIGREHPESIGRLSELAGRAQPNVSRSLSALVGAGLVEVENEGRRSIPRLTALGHEKTGELKLLGDAPAASLSAGLPLGLSVSAESDDASPLSSDRIDGRIAVRLRFHDGQELAGTRDADIVEAALQLADRWWRILYRRDAPFALGDYRQVGDPKPFVCLARSAGRRIELLARRPGIEGGSRLGIGGTFAVEAFADHLLDHVLRPVVRMLRARLRYDRPLQSSLDRIEESRSFPEEFRFCRTAGALGLSPTDLPDEVATSIHRLIEQMEDEEARLDFASAVLADSLDDGWGWVKHEMEVNGERNRLHGLPALRDRCAMPSGLDAMPWQVGITLAKNMRQAICLAVDRSVGGVDGLAQATGVDGSLSFGAKPPGSLLAFRSTLGGEPSVLTSDQGSITSSFVLARAVGDYIGFKKSPSACVSTLYVDRQAVGRAFAAELLAPSQAVVAMINEEDISRHAIAAHFGVSEAVVDHQYRNNAAAARVDA